MAKPSKPKAPEADLKIRTWRPNEADEAILQQLDEKLGLSHTDLLRLAIRRLADVEGLTKKVA
jgi:hypothetical protein